MWISINLPDGAAPCSARTTHMFWWRTACTRSETIRCTSKVAVAIHVHKTVSQYFAIPAISFHLLLHQCDSTFHIKRTVLSSKLKATWFLCKTIKHSESWCALTSWQGLFSLILTNNDSVQKVNCSFVTICTIINTRFPQWITKYWSAAENSPNTQIALD